MRGNAQAAIRRLSSLADAIEALPRIGAEAYADGGGRARPIVDRHFTAGNAARYGWAPLSREYALAKAKGAGVSGKRKTPGTVKLSSGRRVKVDPAVPFASSTGELRGIGSGANLPMLVRSGDLRESILSPTLHKIAMSGDSAVITWFGQPKYAAYHHRGLGRNPLRSPVAPNEEDRRAVSEAMEKWLRAKTGTGGKGPVSGLGGKPRFV